MTAGWSIKRERNRGDLLSALKFLSPNLVGFLVFTTLPVILSLGASFTNWDIRPGVPLHYVGLANFKEMIGEDDFYRFLYNTVFLMLGIPISIAGSLVLALILNQRLRGIVAFRTMFYIPTITSGVALYVMWKALYNPEFGFLNISLYWLIEHLGINGLRQGMHLAPITFDMLPKWHMDVTWAKPSLMLMGIWAGVGGGNMLLYLAGLSNIPVELYEAADLDGAAAWAKFRNVTWPQLAPTTFFVIIMSVIGGLQGGFDQARVMTNGGPAGATTTLGYYIYNKAFLEFRLGYACTVAWTMFAAILVITLINWRFGNRFVESAT
ncbi:MAG TPA: sugar ABC transporter permease [Armatimonadota bacterium]|jgi:multiple sugar transport system permease protein